MKGIGSCGGNERANRVGCMGDGSWEVEELAVRTRTFQATAHGKVVQEIHDCFKVPLYIGNEGSGAAWDSKSFLSLAMQRWGRGRVLLQRHLCPPKRRTEFIQRELEPPDVQLSPRSLLDSPLRML